MDNYGYGQQPQDPIYQYHDKRSYQMATASMILGFASIATFYLVYPSLVCGFLAIIIGLLSKGGEKTVDSRGRLGIVLGVIAIIISIFVLVASIYMVIKQFGSWDNVLKHYQDLLNQSPYGDTI